MVEGFRGDLDFVFFVSVLRRGFFFLTIFLFFGWGVCISFSAFHCRQAAISSFEFVKYSDTLPKPDVLANGVKMPVASCPAYIRM